MLTKFILVVIVMTSDGLQYLDFVDKPLDTKQECEEKKFLFLKSAKQRFDGSHWVIAMCRSPSPLHSVDV